MSAIILGILANALYDLIKGELKGELKGERTLTDIARQIDEYVLSKSKLFNWQRVAKILQEERHAALLKAGEGHQQKQEESTLIRLGDEFRKILLLPENRILQECVNQILTSFQEDDPKRLAMLITTSASQHQFEFDQVRTQLDEIQAQLRIALDNPAEIEQADISRLTGELSASACNLPSSIGSYHRKVDGKVEEILGFLSTDTNAVLVLGEAGSGKSALLKHLYLRLKNEPSRQNAEMPPTVIYLDIGSHTPSTREGLRDSLHLNLDLVYLFKTIASTKNLVILFDGLDEALREKGAVQVWGNIIQEATIVADARIVVSCREYDWTSTDELETLRKRGKPRKIHLSQWNLDSICAALTENELSIPDADVLELLHNPFLLDLYVEIAPRLSNADKVLIRNEVDLYDRYWETRVSNGHPPATGPQMTGAAQWLAEQAENAHIQRFESDTLKMAHPEGADGLIRNSVVLPERTSVRFRHPLLLDYAILRRRGWLTNPELLSDFLRETDYQPFLRSPVFMALRFFIADGEWEVVQSLLHAAVENSSTGWIFNLIDFFVRVGWSEEIKKCLFGFFKGLSKTDRNTYLVHLARRCHNRPDLQWCEVFSTLPEDWIAAFEDTPFHEAASKFLESLLDADSSPQTRASVIRAGQRLERITRQVQMRKLEEGTRQWMDWPIMRYINVLGKTKDPDLIDWLLEVASFPHFSLRIKYECIKQVHWVTNENPSSGAKLLALSLSLPANEPKT